MEGSAHPGGFPGNPCLDRPADEHAKDMGLHMLTRSRSAVGQN